MTSVITWTDFKSQIRALRPNEDDSGCSQLLFRGHGSEDWELETTLDRSMHSDSVRDYYHLILRIKPEIEAFTGRTWPDDPNLSKLDQTLLDYDACSLALLKGQPHYAYMAFLRHHGFPSPLLDWSSSPFVAAYFAFENPVSDNVAIYAYRDRASSFKLSGSDGPFIRQLGPYVAAPLRHFQQRSQYTICMHWNDGNPMYWGHNEVCKQFQLGQEFQQDIIYKFVISRYERDEVLGELHDYNLNAFTLFGSDESLMTALSHREEPKT